MEFGDESNSRPIGNLSHICSEWAWPRYRMIHWMGHFQCHIRAPSPEVGVSQEISTGAVKLLVPLGTRLNPSSNLPLPVRMVETGQAPEEGNFIA